MKGTPPMLELRHVSKSFATTPALRDVSITIPAAQTTALLGPSGCGKSTLLRLMVGLLRPDAGTVLFGGAPLPRDADALDGIRHRMGYVIQDGGLFPHLTARENVMLLAHHLGRDDADTAKRTRELATLVKLPLDAL